MNRIFHILPIVFLITCVINLPGCGDSEAFSLDASVKNLMGTSERSPAEQAKDAFDQQNPDLRRGAIEELMHNAWALREPYIKRFAQLTKPEYEESPTVRAVAVRALGESKNRKYEPEIVAALKDPSEIVQKDAARVLDEMPTKDAEADLRLLAISGKSSDVRSACATALRHYRNDAVFRTLLRCLEDRELNVRKASHSSLRKQTGQDLGMDPTQWSTGKAGSETLPDNRVIYRKRPWWDLGRMTDQTGKIKNGKENKTGDATKATGDKPWWDWFGVSE